MIVELKKDAHQIDVTEEIEIMIEGVITEMRDVNEMTAGGKEADPKSEVVASEIVEDEKNQRMRANMSGVEETLKMIQMSHQKKRKSLILVYLES